jgi:pyruvate ferredoxin oxidoreductase alpha subunit
MYKYEKYKKTILIFMIKKKKLNIKAISGGEAIAYAMKQINPEVVAMYPITPQTPIIETYAKFKADALVSSEIIRSESEHSALSAVVGAQASGVRAMTATASQGLLYMYEILGVASGLRLPIVMPIANRAISSPINIHCDHSDSMSASNQGWMQIYCENSQEGYEYTLFSLKLAEKVNLPIMVCIDGFFTSHTVENVELFEDSKVKKFIGKYKPKYNLLDTTNPITIGPLALPNYYFEIRSGMYDAFDDVEKEFENCKKEFKKTFNKNIELFEDYYANKSDVVIIVMSSTAGTTKEVIDKLRKQGKSVGLLKPRLFRPFIYNKYKDILKNAKKVIVLDRAVVPGSLAPLYSEIRQSLFDTKNKPEIYSHVFGIGGRDIFEKDIEELLLKYINNKIPNEKYIGLRK